MSKFEIGDKVSMPGVPYVLRVEEIGTCDEEECGQETFRFKDPQGRGDDWTHSEEFRKVGER